ncbi:MAG: hypothetical protein V3S95_09140 [Alphaproteobacteria bacterium]
MNASPGQVLATVRLFQWLLPGLIVDVALHRRRLHAGALVSG